MRILYSDIMQVGQCDQRLEEKNRPGACPHYRGAQSRCHAKGAFHLLLVACVDTQANRLAIAYWYVMSFLDIKWSLTILDVCGFFFRDTPNYQPPPDLERFLRSGPPPVYIGFGSIVIEDPPRLTAIILEAIRLAGVRAIISRGWSNLGDGSHSSDIFYIDDCPHEWLFQQVAAVVHHGGAGTTACGLRYGRPTTIVPFFGE